ncbi:hypothetical protein A3A79_01135 [Candidatus Gottesmanbacteria bacterium RIFCSPLOWO2_01_FULL_43_11b]|uniref:Uncharacterized protein n=1 Tax=Candidatus Gottesmanbacteria bacterium RIFCSPLOWO2_01_FULL_43_11b TaxID=1798392 RepID=A0A1F6AGE5_9BACT|nr:MAG: hypothetical protein A3A79_01135 [Candidatus Gottesmanbacteria bacterium RIFCSPLOWO2_01_FULL_43_11b]
MPRAHLTSGGNIEIEGHVWVSHRGTDVSLSYIVDQTADTMRALRALKYKEGILSAVTVGGPAGLVAENNELTKEAGVTPKCILPKGAIVFEIEKIPQEVFNQS